MPVCEGCGGSYDKSFNFCPYCGRAKQELSDINLNVNISVENNKKMIQGRVYLLTVSKGNWSIFKFKRKQCQLKFIAQTFPPEKATIAESPIFLGDCFENPVFFKNSDDDKEWPGSREKSLESYVYLLQVLKNNGWELVQNINADKWLFWSEFIFQRSE